VQPKAFGASDVREPAGAEHVRVDWDSLSLAGQTVEGLLDAGYASSVTARLEALGLRVDPVIDRLIINGPGGTAASRRKIAQDVLLVGPWVPGSGSLSADRLISTALAAQDLRGSKLLIRFIRADTFLRSAGCGASGASTADWLIGESQGCVAGAQYSLSS
jgi:hypothetical protein